MDGGAWWAAVHGVAKSQTQLSNFTFTFHFHALEREMATHSSVLAWRIPGTAEPGGLPSMELYDWSDLAAAAAVISLQVKTVFLKVELGVIDYLPILSPLSSLDLDCFIMFSTEYFPLSISDKRLRFSLENKRLKLLKWFFKKVALVWENIISVEVKQFACLFTGKDIYLYLILIGWNQY